MSLLHWRIADVAGLSYSGPQSARVALDVRVDFVPRGEEIVVVMPGTHPLDALDWARDLFAWPVGIAGIGLVHAGFGQGALEAWGIVDRELRRDGLATYAGHSLGGAMAVGLAALHAIHRPQQPFRLVTFGAPRVGFAAPWLRWRLRSAVEALQYARAGDIVPNVPMRPYLHGGRRVALGASAGDFIANHAIKLYQSDLKTLGV
jgi:hypothetical protein